MQLLSTKTLLVIAALAAALFGVVTQIEKYLDRQEQREQALQKQHDEFKKQMQQKQKEQPYGMGGFDNAQKRSLF